MLPDYLFHPDHIVPGIKFSSAFFETAYCFIAEMLMKFDAVHRQMLVLNLGIAYARIQIDYILRRRDLLNCLIEPPADAVVAVVLGNVDRRLGRMVVCLSADE